MNNTYYYEVVAQAWQFDESDLSCLKNLESISNSNFRFDTWRLRWYSGGKYRLDIEEAGENGKTYTLDPKDWIMVENSGRARVFNHTEFLNRWNNKE